MTTMTIEIENNSILSSLKKILDAIDGVRIVKSCRTTTKADEPNATTIKAINDVKAGKTYHASSVDDLLSQCLD